MMNDFRRKIEKAKRVKQLDKILNEALNEYGYFSNQYNELLSLCWDKLEELK